MKKTCRSGHPFTPNNTSYRNEPSGRLHRVCRICAAETARRYRQNRANDPRLSARTMRLELGIEPGRVVEAAAFVLWREDKLREIEGTA